MRIRLVTLIGSHVDVLPFMLAHYRCCGVDTFHVNVHMATAADPVLDQVRIVTSQFGCDIGSINVGGFRDYELSSWRSSMQAHPNDWWILADQDELHCFPDDLRSLLSYCDRHDYDYIEGAFVDRVASDGMLRRVDPNSPLEAQFPLGGIVSARLMSYLPPKIVAARGWVLISTGHHSASTGIGWPASEMFVEVHHFKWTAGLLDRLRHRHDPARPIDGRNGLGNARIIRYYETHNHRIDTTDSGFLFALCQPSYPHWPLVAQFVLARRSRRSIERSGGGA